MSAQLMETALGLVGTSFGFYAHHKQLEQAHRLHEHEHAVSTQQHYASLSTELLAIAKEADRDVWEQRNNQYSQMLVCAVLMFGVAVGNINEGTYAFDSLSDKHGLEPNVLFSRDGAFVLFSAMAIASLFVCIVSCLLVMRRMSTYMVQRSSNLVDRLAVCTGLAHQISAQAEHGLDSQLGGERRRFHDKIGAAIGSGPKHGDSAAVDYEEPSTGSAAAAEEDSSRKLRFAGLPTRWSGRSEARQNGLSAHHQPLLQPKATLGHSFSLFRNEDPHAPLNFSIFYRDSCQWLTVVITWSFVLGVVGTWSALFFLLWNQFPHLFLPVFAFLGIGFVAVAVAGALEVVTRRSDQVIAMKLRNDTPRYPTRTPLQRLQELEQLLEARLVTPGEYATKRASILAAL